MPRRGPSPSLALVPKRARLPGLVRAARECHACHLYAKATQTVFGEGPAPAELMFIGEQPGDQEDRQGHPFVGPAGKILDKVFATVGISRDEVYLTNSVKHFKWTPQPRGKRRMHARPNAEEVHACHGWLEAEIAIVRPSVIVCLGATAANAVLGPSFKLMANRGEPQQGSPWAAHVIATYHPSALLRMMRDPEAYERAKTELEADLRVALSLLA